ncbi:hypothetical protein MNBD_BACTEROID01-915 [hydrothermal vent metagenome]|uniref:Glycosyltransferase RgtA/B/C/D-like domain-containing protein n=1 Tax=hydrothermal vent metagenome TaxID=652676 RepID=A0A3B0TY85_9ZZZZ
MGTIGNIKKYRLIILLVFFLASTSIGALNYIFHYPDEKHYTDAAIIMIGNHDYMTPYNSDGTTRFLKPILTYWFVSGSYKLFGVSQFSSRFLFWLVGGLIVLATYFMAASLTGNKEIAWIATLITATNPLLIISASRSIPDILQVLFLTISAWGFMGIMMSEHRKKIYHWLAYLGTALAFETKGIPAVAFAAASILFLLFNPWKRKEIKDIIEPVSMITATVVALSWFIIMYLNHGTAYLDSFFNDQVGERVSRSAPLVAKNVSLAIITLLLFLLPWVLAITPSFKNPGKGQFSFLNQIKPVVAFILCWTVLILVMSGLVFRYYDRYVLPVIPILSILIAYSVYYGKTKFLKPSIAVLLSINIFIIMAEVVFMVYFSSGPIVLAGIISGIFLIILGFATKFYHNHRVEALAASILFLVFNAFLLMYPIAIPDQEAQIVEKMEKEGLMDGRPVYVYGNIKNASKIRVDSYAECNVISMDSVYTVPDGKNHVLVFRDTDMGKLAIPDYKIITGSVAGGNLKLRFKSAFWERQLKYIRKKGETFLIAYPH